MDLISFFKKPFYDTNAGGHWIKKLKLDEARKALSK